MAKSMKPSLFTSPMATKKLLFWLSTPMSRLMVSTRNCEVRSTASWPSPPLTVSAPAKGVKVSLIALPVLLPVRLLLPSVPT